MTDLATIVTTPGVQSRIREAMRRSSVHRVDDKLPDPIANLLAELDEARESRAPR